VLAFEGFFRLYFLGTCLNAVAEEESQTLGTLEQTFWTAAEFKKKKETMQEDHYYYDPDLTEEDEIKEPEEDRRSRNIGTTVSVLTQRLGFVLRCTTDTDLKARVVLVGRGNGHHPLLCHVEYPLGTGVVWKSISGSARQAYLDACLLRGDIPKFCVGQDGPTGNISGWEYLAEPQVEGEESWIGLHLLLTKEVRNGDACLRPDSPDLPAPDLTYEGINPYRPRTRLVNNIDNLLSLFPERADLIESLKDEKVGTQYLCMIV
jgi:hypothetical protein